MVKEKSLSLKQKMNLEEKAIFNLLDKICFLAYSDDEKLEILKFIRLSRLRYLEFEKQLLMERQASGKNIKNYLYVSKNHSSNI